MGYDQYGKYQESASFTGKHIIRHYYGDSVRLFFLGAAVVSAVSIPMFGNLLPFGTWTQVSGTLLLALFAGLTNPHSKFLFFCDIALAGVGVLLLEMSAISFYAQDSFELFLAREAAALALLFAFYFSIKTLRSMFLGDMGTLESPRGSTE